MKNRHSPPPWQTTVSFYLMSVAGGFTTYLLLSVFLGNNIHLSRFLIPLSPRMNFFGSSLYVFGHSNEIFYQKMEQLSQKLSIRWNKPVLKGIISGLVPLLGAYTISPLTLFSGERNEDVLMDS